MGGTTVTRSVVITGSRDWDHESTIHNWIARLPKDVVVVDGGARGADQVAHEYARRHGHDYERFPVDPSVDGPWPSAGPRRNERMLERTEPMRVFAFSTTIERGRENGSIVLTVGTGQCVLTALRMGIPVTICPSGSKP